MAPKITDQHIRKCPEKTNKQTTTTEKSPSDICSGSSPSPCRLASSASAGGFVSGAAAVARDGTAMAGTQRCVAAHAGRDERQAEQREPAQDETPVTGVAGAGFRILALGVGHAVVQQAVGAPHEAHAPYERHHRVGRFLALPSPVLRRAEHVPAVHAAHALVLRAPRGPRLTRHHAAADARFPVVSGEPVRVRVRVVMFGRFALGEGDVSVRRLRAQEFVGACGSVTVVLVAR